MRKHHLVDAQGPTEPLREAKEALGSPALIDIARRRSQGQLDHLLYAGWGFPEVLCTCGNTVPIVLCWASHLECPHTEKTDPASGAPGSFTGCASSLLPYISEVLGFILLTKLSHFLDTLEGGTPLSHAHQLDELLGFLLGVGTIGGLGGLGTGG